MSNNVTCFEDSRFVEIKIVFTETLRNVLLTENCYNVVWAGPRTYLQNFLKFRVHLNAHLKGESK